MDLILWRHAEAEDGSPDLGRALTPKGEKQARKMAAFLNPRLPTDMSILASPAIRTQQTALALARPFETVQEIAPGASVRMLLEAAGWPGHTGCVMLVGHQPVLGQLAAHLVGSAASEFSIKKGAIWWLRHREGYACQADVRLVISPDQL